MNPKLLFPALISLLSLAPAAAQEAGTGTAPPALDAAVIERLVGVRPAASGAELKVSVPQTDLSVTVDGFRIIPPMGLTSWAAFTPAGGGAMVMGDIVVLEDEVGPVQKAAVEAGLSVTGLHNHFVRDEPGVMFMHIHGMGPVDTLARGVRAALDAVRGLRRSKRLASRPAVVETTFDPKTIERIVGAAGTMDAGVYKITLGRPDVKLTDHGVPVSTFLGFNTWMAFQGTAEKAAVAGDFAMLEHEVAPVVAALVRNGIEVVAIHNHMTTEQPRTYFLHFWGVGPVDKLARGLKAGLDQTGRR